MGNHEWCVECEQSDFHRGRPCLPRHLAAARARRAAAKVSRGERARGGTAFFGVGRVPVDPIDPVDPVDPVDKK
jgi:hypothetical protein